MHRTWFLIVTAVVETGAGLALLLVPSISLTTLLGISPAEPAALVIARVGGAALLSIGITSFLARRDNHGPAQLGVLIGLLFYNVAAASLLTYAGAVLKMVGLVLWPGVALHAALAVWCVMNFRGKPQEIG